MALMQLWKRIVLLMGAVLCGGWIAQFGGAFSRAVEPESYDGTSSLFYFVVGSLVSAPLWVPALIPSRFFYALLVCRWGGAIAMLLPTAMFGSIVVHNVRRSASGLGLSPSALTQGAVLTASCLVCIAILVWPERRKGEPDAI